MEKVMFVYWSRDDRRCAALYEGDWLTLPEIARLFGQKSVWSVYIEGTYYQRCWIFVNHWWQIPGERPSLSWMHDDGRYESLENSTVGEDDRRWDAMNEDWVSSAWDHSSEDEIPF
jgi:hypothetical protein